MKALSTCQNWSITLIIMVKAWRRDKNPRIISALNLSPCSSHGLLKPCLQSEHLLNNDSQKRSKDTWSHFNDKSFHLIGKRGRLENQQESKIH